MMTPPHSTEPPPDRRKHMRYTAKEVVLVSPVAADRKYWKMLDVSRGGMSFRYIPSIDLRGVNEIDILTQDLDFALEGIPFKVISDCEFVESPASFIELRRCGVEFGKLTHLQEAIIIEFIQRYAFP
jgi:c-di-GMP-binding flagellar brake protein YcgR